jgi:hypothetical protein
MQTESVPTSHQTAYAWIRPLNRPSLNGKAGGKSFWRVSVRFGRLGSCKLPVSARPSICCSELSPHERVAKSGERKSASGRPGSADLCPPLTRMRF